jgi:hypothetical protein
MQNYIFKLQEDFSDLAIRVFILRMDLEISGHILFYRFDTNQEVKNILKTVLITRLKIKETTYIS